MNVCYITYRVLVLDIEDIFEQTMELKLMYKERETFIQGVQGFNLCVFYFFQFNLIFF